MEVTGRKLESETDCVLFCEPCEVENLQTSADGACRECKEYMCDTCFGYHLKSKRTRNHMLLSLDEFSTLKLSSGSEDITKCEKHDNENIKFYCPSHDSVGCGDCIVSEHAPCKPEFIRNMMETSKGGDKLKNIKIIVEHLETKTAYYKHEIEKGRKEFAKMYEKALKEIKDFRKEINKYLDESETKIFSELKKLQVENKEKQTKIETGLQSLSSELAKMQKMFDTKVHRDNALFINAVNCKSKLAAIEKMYEQVTEVNVVEKLDFNRNEQMIAELKKERPLGSLKTKTRQIEHEQKQFVVGVRVRRGPDWKHSYQTQGGGKPGTVIGFAANGWANVKWDNGYINSYRIGQENSYDIEII